MVNRRVFLQTSATATLAAASSWNPNEETQPLDQILKTLIRSSDLAASFGPHLLLKAGLIHLNTGSLGPCPDFILNAVHSSILGLERDPVSQYWGSLGEAAEEVRQKIADFIGAEREEILLTQNTTEGMNLIGSGLRLQPGDEILTTNHEHPGGMVCWEYMAKQIGIEIKSIQMPAPVESQSQIMDFVEKNLSPKTRVCSFSHVCTITGLRMPFTEIASLVRPRGILLVCDGAQAAGMIPVNVQELGVDVYATSGHKWLLGPKGTGFCYLRKAWQDRIQPVLSHSGYLAYTASSGTRNLPLFLGLGLAVDLNKGLGSERILNQWNPLRAHLLDRIGSLNGIKILSPMDPGLGSAMITIQLLDKRNTDIFEALLTRSIVVKLAPKYNALRISTHFFNTRSEVDRLIDNLLTLL